MSLSLLIFQTGWEATKAVNSKNDHEITITSITLNDIQNGDIWFDALVQVLFSTNIGIGLLPVITGKFIYKGDAVRYVSLNVYFSISIGFAFINDVSSMCCSHRTSLVYISSNVLVLILSTTFFLVQFNNVYTLNSTISIPELKPFTAVYDNALEYADAPETAFLTGLTYAMIVLVTVLGMAVQIYTASRVIRRHPNYVMSGTALVVAITILICPNYLVARLFDTRVVGAFIVCALIFDIVSITWIYGAKNIYTDLEFSIGRPISKIWVFLWCMSPIIIATLLMCWLIAAVNGEVVMKFVPRWLPIAIGLSIIAFLAFTEVYKQVDYNCCSMIREAGISSKDWGPADPIVRHAWKQWTSVCEDTGQKDFTLRRRGTRDYTHSIKRNQCSQHKANSAYSIAPPPGNPTNSYVIKTSTLGRGSPNYAGSIFGDSAIEEDISIGNYPVHYNTTSQRMIVPDERTKSTRSINNDPRKMIIRLQQSSIQEKQKIYVPPPIVPVQHKASTLERARVTANGIPSDYSSRIIINSPQRHTIIHSNTLNSHSTENYGSLRRAQNPSDLPSLLSSNGSDHICWRKYTNNPEEFSTEL